MCLTMEVAQPTPQKLPDLALDAGVLVTLFGSSLAVALVKLGKLF